MQPSTLFSICAHCSCADIGHSHFGPLPIIMASNSGLDQCSNSHIAIINWCQHHRPDAYLTYLTICAPISSLTSHKGLLWFGLRMDSLLGSELKCSTIWTVTCNNSWIIHRIVSSSWRLFILLVYSFQYGGLKSHTPIDQTMPHCTHSHADAWLYLYPTWWSSNASWLSPGSFIILFACTCILYHSHDTGLCVINLMHHLHRSPSYLVALLFCHWY
jgi:hypothetical protein